MKRLKADVVFRGAKILNVFTDEWEEGDIAVVGGKIAAVGKGYEGEKVVDATGLFALPGLIDSHVHVESTQLSPEEFTCITVPSGTTGIVADPHELTNVCGIAGAEYLYEAFDRLKRNGKSPIDVYMQLPSCVPATPFETSGAKIDGRETASEIARPIFFGLGEMMSVPAVLSGDADCLEKLTATKAQNKPIDGHAPALTGEGVCAYAAAGIQTDHEPVSNEECLEKVRRGMYIQLRNGSSAKNVGENAKAVTPFNFRRFLLCSDDKTAHDLLTLGHMNDALKVAVASGIPAEWAVCMATINVAECYRISGKGAIAPSYDADLVFVADLKDFRVKMTVKAGEIVAKDGKYLWERPTAYLPETVKNTVRVKDVSAEDLKLHIKSNKAKAIRVLPHSISTVCDIVDVESKGGDVVLEGTELCKIASVERHFASGRIGLGLVNGYGLKSGAIGISVAHDSHNLVVLGKNNADMARVIELLKKAGGGMAYCFEGGEGVFPLDIAGLMSSAPAETVARETAKLSKLAYEAGVKREYEPFMTLAFLSLPVIPKLRITDKGLFDVDKFSFTEIEA